MAAKQNQDNERWGEVETINFLAILKQFHIVQQLDTNKKHSIVFGNVAKELLKKGHTRTVDQLKQRWRNLKCTYSKEKRKFNTSGCGGKKPKFYDDMDELLGNRPKFNLTNTGVESIEVVDPEAIFNNIISGNIEVETSISSVEDDPSPEDIPHELDDGSSCASKSQPPISTTPSTSTSRNGSAPQTESLVSPAVIRRRGKRTGGTISWDESLKKFATEQKTCIDEVITKSNTTNQKFMSEELEKIRIHERELMQAHLNSQRENMERFMMFLRVNQGTLDQPKSLPPTAEK